MKSFTAAGAVFLFVGLPAVMPAQRAAVPGQLASAPETPLSLSFPVEAVARPAAIADVRDEQHDRRVNALWIASIAAMLAGTSADAISSWHKTEGNSLLASSDGMFGAKGVSIKAGIAAGVLLPQILLRKHKDLRPVFAVGNFAEAGVFTGAAIHNFQLDAP